MKGHRGAVAYCVRADARRSWPAWLVLGVLVGLAAGSVMAAAAGARRTESAYQDLRRETNAMDGAVVFACNPEIDADCPETTEEIRALPGIADAAGFESQIVPILDDDGRLVQVSDDPCASGGGAIDLTAPSDPAFGTTLQGIRIVDGRAADPRRADEVVMTPLAAEELGIEVGDHLYPHLVRCDLARRRWGPPVEVTVVGLGLTTIEVRPKNGFYIQSLHATPAFAALPEWQALVAADESPPLVGVRLEDGVTFADLRDQPSFPPVQEVLDVEEQFTRPVDEGLQSDANALWLLALVGGAASLFVLAPTLTRYRGDAAATDVNLAALGWGRADRVARSALHGLAISAAAVAVAVAFGLLVSTQTPIGDARAIEPSPGPELDLAVAALGAAATTVLVVGVLILLALRSPRPDRSPRRTPLARLAGRAGLSAPGVLGIRIGLEPGRGQAPVRSSVLAVALGLTAVTGALVYTSSAQHLRETPAWIGLGWDDFVYVNDNPDGIRIAEAARTWPEVEAVSHALFFTPTLTIGPDHEPSHVMAFSTGPDAVEPTVMAGRAPAGVDDLLLSPKLAEALGLTVGDRIDVTYDLSEMTGGELGAGEPFAMEVVGIGPVPLADGNFSLGSAVTFDGMLAHLPPELTGGDEDPRADFLLIDRADGVGDDEIAARLAEAGIEIDPEFPSRAEYAETVVAVDPTSTEAAPDLLAALMAVMAGGVLAYGLAVAVSRNGPDLAVARALGFTPGLLRRSGRWAGALFAAAALVVAIPVGLVLGRVVWRGYAEDLGVVPDPVTAPWEIVALAVATLLLGIVVGALAARWQGRTRTAEVLRSE